MKRVHFIINFFLFPHYSSTWKKNILISNHVHHVYFMIQINFYKPKDVQNVKSFKILNNLITSTLLDLAYEMWRVKWRKWIETWNWGDPIPSWMDTSSSFTIFMDLITILQVNVGTFVLSWNNTPPPLFLVAKWAFTYNPDGSILNRLSCG